MRSRFCIILLIVICCVACSSDRTIETLFYYQHRHLSPENSKVIRAKNLRKELKKTLEIEKDTLSWPEWERVYPILWLYYEFGWCPNEDIQRNFIGYGSIEPCKYYIEDAYYWSLKHKEELDDDRIFKYLKLMEEYSNIPRPKNEKSKLQLDSILNEISSLRVKAN